jgi:drug/metabolite transporter (DMT)-like permease
MSQPHPNTLLAAAWMSGAILSFTSMAVAGREVSFQLDTFEIMTYRSLLGFIIVIIVATAFGKLPEINTNRLGLHFGRNIFHFIGQNLWFFALTLIPFAQLFAFEFSVPVWIAIAAPFFLGEKLTRSRAMTIALGFIGILIVTRPWISGLSWGVIAAAFCAVGFAGSLIFTKQLTKTTSITCIMFWLTAMQLAFGLLCAGYDGDIQLPSLQTLPWVIVISFAGLFAHFCLTNALRVAPALVVTPMDFTRLPIIAIIGMTFYNEALDLWVLVGAVVIFVANYVNILAEQKSHKNQSHAS